MSNIYSRESDASLIPVSGEKELNENVVTSLIPSNDSRAYLTIRVGQAPVTLYDVKDDQGNGVNVIEELKSGEVYSLPVPGGVYKGANELH